MITGPYSPGATGIFRMPVADYDNAAAIRQSALKDLARSPAHYRAARLAPPEPPTEAMILGTVTHAAVLENAEASSRAHIRPPAMDFRTTTGKEWKAKHSDRPIVTESDAQAVLGMRKAILNHETAAAALWRNVGENEIALFGWHTETGLMCKARPDRITADDFGNTLIVDLKTTEDASPDEFAKTVAKFRYHVQAAYYCDLAVAVGLESPLFMFVVVEKAAPFAVACYVLDPAAIEQGRATYRRELELLAKCMASNEWPAYGDGMRILGLPRWARMEAA